MPLILALWLFPLHILLAVSFPGPDSTIFQSIASQGKARAFTGKDFPIAEMNRVLSLTIDKNSCTANVRQTFYNSGKKTLYFSLYLTLPKEAKLLQTSTPLKPFVSDKTTSEEQAIAIAKAHCFPAIIGPATSGQLLCSTAIELKPHRHKTLKVSYSLQPFKSGTEHVYTIPYRMQGNIIAPVKRASLTIKTVGGLANHVHSLTHKLTQITPGSPWTYLTFKAYDHVPEEDIVLVVSPQKKSNTSHTLTAVKNDSCYVRTHIWAEKKRSRKNKPKARMSPGPRPRACLFVMDVSGSLFGNRLTLEKAAVKDCIQQLSENDYLNIIPFSLSPRSWHFEYKKATTENIKDAITYVDNLKAGGATNLGETIQQTGEIASTAPDGSDNKVFLITDGIADVGIIDPDQLLKLTDHLLPENCRMYIVSIGANVDCRLLATIARERNGQYLTSLDESTLSDSLLRLFSLAMEPELLNHTITIRQKGIPLTLWQNHPASLKKNLPLLFGGETKNSTSLLEITHTMRKKEKVQTEVRQNNPLKTSMNSESVALSVNTLRMKGHITSFVETITPSESIPPSLSKEDESLLRYVLRIPSGKKEQQLLREFRRSSGKNVVAFHRLIEQLDTTGTFLPRPYNGMLYSRRGKRYFFYSSGRWIQMPLQEKTIPQRKITYGSKDWRELVASNHETAHILSLGTAVTFEQENTVIKVSK